MNESKLLNINDYVIWHTSCMLQKYSQGELKSALIRLDLISQHLRVLIKERDTP